VALLALLALAFTAVAVRLVDLQAVSPDEFAARGIAQRMRTEHLAAERGSIFDRNGHELALSVPQHTVWAEPRAIADPAATAAALGPVLGLDVAALTQKLTGKGGFAYVARQIDDAKAGEVRALGLAGINLVAESKRFAPSGSLAASIIGETDIDNKGISGVESIYDRQLVGTPGELQIERGPDGSTIAGGREQVHPAVRGNDLVLTIDQSLQFEVERQLAKALEEHGAAHATAVVMDPTTGEILAMASVGRGPDGAPRSSSENRAVTSAFEPGSVNKVITMAAGLEEGVIKADEKLLVPDHMMVGPAPFSDHDPHPTMEMSITDILSASSNIGTIMVAEKLGETRMDAYLRRFGLGQVSGLGFPGETAGIMQPLPWRGTDIGSVPIGQGVAVNALQMLQVFNTLANDGVWVQPTLVRATVDARGREQRTLDPKKVQVVSKTTARQLRAMMSEVVAKGTGTNAAIKGYTVAGKTGTAKKTLNGAYQTGDYISSFAGFVPAESPRLSAIVVIDEPRPTYFASIVAAPTFASINQYALGLFKIPPPATAVLPDVPTVQAGSATGHD
jgi:cell division protein FtsI (penicillin-binding protein 3)